jgi:threonine synthase
MKLYCTNCSKEFDIEKLNLVCDVCNEPIEVEEVKEGKIREGNTLRQSILDRYAEFFPSLEADNELSLGEGFTPLTNSAKLAERFRVKGIYFKNETQNPTWSFKDRGTFLGVNHAVKLGYKRIGTVSTGNMAASIAAYGAKGKFETFIFVNQSIADEKLGPIAIYNPHLVRVEGDYSKLYYESLEIGKKNDIYFINSDVPFRVEGSKTIAYEICEQMNFDMPDYVIIPTSAGGNLRGIEKGFREFKACGLIDRAPVIICAQASGCSPIYNAYFSKSESIIRVENPDTIAHAIGNPFPPSGNQVLRLMKRGMGFAVSVPDDEIIKAQALLAQEGIFAQPGSAVPLAVVNKLSKENYFKGNEKIVCVVTGGGLKYTAALQRHSLKTSECKLEGLSNFIDKSF